MDDLVQREYAQAKCALRNLMGLIEENIPWPDKGLDKCLAGVFAGVIDDLAK